MRLTARLNMRSARRRRRNAADVDAMVGYLSGPYQEPMVGEGTSSSTCAIRLSGCPPLLVVA